MPDPFSNCAAAIFAFNSLVDDRRSDIAAAPEAPGSTAMLLRLRARSVRTYLISPAHNVAQRANARGLHTLFDDIADGVADSAALLGTVVQRAQLDAHATVFVGRGDHDRAAAAAVGVRFVDTGPPGANGLPNFTALFDPPPREPLKPPGFYRRFDYDRALLPNAQLRALESGVDNLDAAREKSCFSIGYPGWGLIYYALLNHFHWSEPNDIVETGSNVGASTIVLAQAVKDAGAGGHVHSIELNPEFAQRARTNVAAAGLSDVATVYQGSSLERLPDLVRSLDTVRAAFLDGSHQCNDVVAEFEMLHPKLAPGAIVLFDNTAGLWEGASDERVFGALKSIKQRFGGSIINFEFTSWFTPGLAIWQAR